MENVTVYRRAFTPSDWQEHLEYLKHLQKEFIIKYDRFCELLPIFHDLTKQCCEILSECPERFMEHYVREWFRLFLGMTDECLMLINGAVARNYYMKDHTKFSQDRRQKGVHKNALLLSACSVDGMD